MIAFTPQAARNRFHRCTATANELTLDITPMHAPWIPTANGLANRRPAARPRKNTSASHSSNPAKTPAPPPSRHPNKSVRFSSASSPAKFPPPIGRRRRHRPRFRPGRQARPPLLLDFMAVDQPESRPAESCSRSQSSTAATSCLLAIEGVLRRDLSLAVKERFVQVGLVFLLGILAFVMYSDILKVVQSHH